MEIRDCIMEAFEEILERMAFLYFEESEDISDANDMNQYDYITEVSFNGILTGKFNLFINENQGELIARNLLGIRDEDVLIDGTVKDAICEFTNMIVGRTMTLINASGKFELGVPFITENFQYPPVEEKALQINGLLEEKPCMLLLQYRPN